MEFLGGILFEALVIIPGAFLIALAKGKPKKVMEVAGRQYFLSLVLGSAAWVSTIVLIRYLVMGCVICDV